MKKEITDLLNLIRANNLDKAQHLATNLYNKDQNDLFLIKILAYIYMQRSAYSIAVTLLKRGIKLKPEMQDYDYFNNLGYSLLKMEEFKEALFYLDKAFEIDEDSSTLYTNYAEIYTALRDFEKANNYIDKSISKIELEENSLINQHISVFWYKSNINTALNKDDETVKIFLDMLGKSFNENIFYLLSSVSPKSISQEILATAIEKLKTNSSFKNKLERFYFVTPLFFGLAMYYQKIDQTKSENYFHLGNEEIFQSTRYNSYDYQNKISQVISHFEDNLKGLKSANSELGKNNFFIVGSPRSGTTLLESIISSNDEVFAGGELFTAKNLMGSYLMKKFENINDIENDFRSKYIRRTDYIRGKHKYIVDKLPENFLYIGYFLRFLPKTKFIRIFRNPWDTAISLYKQRYVQNIPYSASFFNIGVFMANFEAINLYWNEAIIDKDRFILDVKYEDLVRNSDTTQVKIYDFLGIKANYDNEKRDSFFSTTASIRQVKGGIHKESIEKQEFIDKKDEFYQSFDMQRKYWKMNGLVPENSSFFGYEIK